MCGRYVLFNDSEYAEFLQIVEDIDILLNLKSGEIFPTDAVPIIATDNYKKKLMAAKWGFPKFGGPGSIINARSETVEEKAMFRRSFFSKRCLVPAHGFYEWKQETGKKIKYLIKTNDQNMFYMAGLYNTFMNKDNKSYTGFVILTTSPNSVMEKIHSRMPVILPQNLLDLWLTGDIPKVKSILKPYDSDLVSLLEIG
ncbi:MAG: SOS response-associated peptidase [Clostridia bacterium]|nr:SOS response-associated peptidase [Clostridia bacterium]